MEDESSSQRPQCRLKNRTCTDAARTYSFPVRRRRIGKGVLSPLVFCRFFRHPPLL
jgi:hypothetical protein